ncbi:MAG: DNA-3-methyladenine glycosylase 2 family protein [Intrasporangium sp.]|uniref:DNA-3-methyladenine glycosylase family protein n=1 Tax=Intrasporangium sp. TaxID=1925024 RepID=UPI002648CF0C|nr:DNA-3-methyladenine glycosylase 2 family protein [Intrasporangium sp.]MDN5796665.1 DNA-3-methyladenine glycosylase 2 family protein [Intrasporangium sp.]
MTTGRTRVWHAGRPIHLAAQLSAFRRGSGDPTWWTGDGAGFARAAQTPDGAGVLHLLCRPGIAAVEAEAWGPAAQWLLDSVPDLLGAGDDPSGFRAVHAPVGDAWHRFAHYRVPRSRLVLDALVPAIIEQKVTGQEAFAGYRRLVRRFGEPAPGPFGDRLVVPPTAHGWASIPSWEFLRAQVDPARSRAVVAAAQVAGRLEQIPDLTPVQARRRLRAVPGVGVWTAAEVAQRALGDADAVSFGDFHVAKDIGWALTGRPVDDAGLAGLLEPYRGHRFRVQQLLALAGHRRARRGPRMPPRRHLPVGPTRRR